MPENKTALAGLAIFKDALVALKSKIVQEDTPQGAYEFKDEKITQGKRQKANNEALALLREFQLDPSRKAKKTEKKVDEKQEKINKLNKDLQKAIKDERYEDAAKIRDEIKKLQ